MSIKENLLKLDFVSDVSINDGVYKITVTDKQIDVYKSTLKSCPMDKIIEFNKNNNEVHIYIVMYETVIDGVVAKERKVDTSFNFDKLINVKNIIECQ